MLPVRGFEIVLFLKLELGLLLLPACKFEYPLFLKDGPLMLFDITKSSGLRVNGFLLDGPLVLFDIAKSSGLRVNGFLLDEPSNLGFTSTEFNLLDGPGGGINARADICLCINSSKGRRVKREH